MYDPFVSLISLLREVSLKQKNSKSSKQIYNLILKSVIFY